MKTVFLRAIEATDKAAALVAAIREPEAAIGKQRFEVDLASFASLPRAPFAYWMSGHLRQLFRTLPSFDSNGPQATVGTVWFPFVKGGAFSPYYSDTHLLVDWRHQGAQSHAIYAARHDEVGGIIKNPEYYFRPGLTWPSRPHKRGGFSCVPAGGIFSVSGMMLFQASSAELLVSCAVLNSAAYRGLLGALMPRGSEESGQTLKYEIGYISAVPVPNPSEHTADRLSRLVRCAWSLKRSLDTSTETSHAFTLPALLQVEPKTLSDRADAWGERLRSVRAELATTQTEIDDCCFDLYSINEADRRVLTEGFGGASGNTSEEAGTETDGDAESDADESEDTAADAANLAAELVSWAVGVAFGRFDVRLATGDRPLPTEPEPFDPLPVCSPAMLTGGDGLPLSAAPPGYPLTLPDGGLLVDDPGHARDLTVAARVVFEVVFGAEADACWSEAATLLDPKDHNLRNWLNKGLFEHHLKRHSKSRRKAPIVWQFATPSSSYSVWLYAHQLTKDSFFQLQNDLVAQKLAHEERKHLGLVQAAGPSPSASHRKEIAAQETLVEELRAMLDEVKRIAPLWQLDLNDGIVLTMAPLWRLVPQHRPWQRELKAAWDALSDGKYDWAHLAMHLWPERVVPKCATDRSLAITHGLEEVFWMEGADGKWTLRSTPTRTVEELVHERSSSAVKAALKSLLEAPLATAPGVGRGRGSRVAPAAGRGSR